MYTTYEKVLESFAQKRVAIRSMHLALRKVTVLFGQRKVERSFAKLCIEKNIMGGRQSMRAKELSTLLLQGIKVNQTNANTAVQQAENVHTIGQMLTTNIQETLMTINVYVARVIANMIKKIIITRDDGVNLRLCQN